MGPSRGEGAAFGAGGGGIVAATVGTDPFRLGSAPAAVIDRNRDATTIRIVRIRCGIVLGGVSAIIKSNKKKGRIAFCG